MKLPNWNTTTWIIIIVIVVIAIYILSRVFSRKSSFAIQPGTGSSTGSEGAPSDCNDNFPLKLGSCGGRVEILQERLNKICGSNLTEDGDFGQNTQAVVNSCVPKIYSNYPRNGEVDDDIYEKIRIASTWWA